MFESIELLSGEIITLTVAKTLCLSKHGKLPKPSYESIVYEKNSERVFLVNHKSGFYLRWVGPITIKG